MTGGGQTVHVVSWVYWNGDEQGGGGFDWFPDAGRAEEAFRAERTGWGSGPARIRLVTVPGVPLVLGPKGITDWLDNRVDDLERWLPARKVALCVPPRGDGVDSPDPRLGRCPDDGYCHGRSIDAGSEPCDPGECYRVKHAGPLSGVFPGDRWPAKFTAPVDPETRGWRVEAWGAGWVVLADDMASEEEARSLLDSLVVHRKDGALGLRVAAPGSES